MIKLMGKAMIISSLLALAVPAVADDYLCSYTARLSKEDKYNSSGQLIAKNYSNNTVAAVLRQDRANYYVYGKANREDQGDCVFSNKNARAKRQSYLASGSMPEYARRIIIDNTPLVQVDVYSQHVEVTIIENGERAPRSSIQ